MNVFSFTGNLGKPAEQKYIASGDSVVEFSVAVKSGFGDKAATTWTRCAMWGKRGESVLPYLTKGQLVGIVGELTLREYTDKEGQNRTSLDVRVNDLTLLGKKDESAPRQRSKPESAAASPGNFDDFADDIPF